MLWYHSCRTLESDGGAGLVTGAAGADVTVAFAFAGAADTPVTAMCIMLKQHQITNRMLSMLTFELGIAFTDPHFERSAGLLQC